MSYGLFSYGTSPYASEPTSGAVTGTINKTNANDTMAAAGTTTIIGSIAKTNANDTMVASGSPTIVGTLAKTNNNDMMAASGSPTIQGSIAKTNNNDTMVASGFLSVTGTINKTNNNDSMVASGTAGAATQAPIAGSGKRHHSIYMIQERANQQARIESRQAPRVEPEPEWVAPVPFVPPAQPILPEVSYAPGPLMTYGGYNPMATMDESDDEQAVAMLIVEMMLQEAL
jgi:hypothetical protein